MRLGRVITVNPESIRNGYPFDEIEYINISSVGTGTLQGAQHLQLASAPSRAKRIVSPGDTLLATVRPNLRSFLFARNPKKNTIASTGFAVLRANRDIDSRFLYYTVTNQPFTDYLTANAKGAAYPAVDTDTIERAEIYLPTLPSQRKIAAILSAYDDLIENNNRRIKILEEMAQAIYREWFVHFRFPGHEKVKMVDSPLGKIPEGWVVNTLGDVSTIIMGQSPKSIFYNETSDGLPFHQGVTDFGSHFPTDRIFCTALSRIAEAGDVLFSVRAPVGRINISSKRIVIGRGLCAIRSRHGHQSFVLYQMKNRFDKEDLMGSGTIFKAVTKDDVHGISFLSPSLSLIDDYHQQASKMLKQIEVLTKKNTNLRQTRDLLLPRLISGEVDVSNLDIDTGGLNA